MGTFAEVHFNAVLLLITCSIDEWFVERLSKQGKSLKQKFIEESLLRNVTNSGVVQQTMAFNMVSFSKIHVTGTPATENAKFLAEYWADKRRM